MCHAIFIGTVLLAVSATASAEASSDSFEPKFLPTLSVARVNGAVKVDGELDEPAWARAALAAGFAETNPGDQVKPPVDSKVLVGHDQSNLYVALLAFDDPEDVRVSLRERDNIWDDDYFGILLDTYGEQAWGYHIFVNPLGIQGDLRFVSGQGEDISMDIVFESVGKVTDSGYQVEIAIPFASLRFPDRPVHTWRANFWRDRRRENRNQYAWAAQDRDNPCWMCQWGYLTGIQDIKPGTNLEILPNLVGFQTGSLADDENPHSDFDNSHPDAEFSLNARYGLSSSASAEITLNPDFSQIESDANQIDVNTTFGLWFPERRPFFQEGSDLFQTHIRAVYTRSVNDPQVAAKFTGQSKGTSSAYLVARDENSTMLLPFAEQSVSLQADKATVNIVRLRQSFLEDSYVGVLVTDRRLDDFTPDGEEMGGGSGTVYGLDGAVRFLKNYRLAWQVLGSHTRELDAPGLVDTTQKDGCAQQFFDRGRHTVALDGESFGGHAVWLGFERSEHRWSIDLDYEEFSPTFRTDNGFVTRNGHRSLLWHSRYYFEPNGEWLLQWGPTLGIGRIWEHAGLMDLDPTSFSDGPKDEWIQPGLYFSVKGLTDIGVSYLNSREWFGGQLFEGISRVYVNIDSRFSELLSGGMHLTYGRSIYRARAREYEEVIPADERESPEDSIRTVSIRPELGKQTDFSIHASLKPTQRLAIEPDFNFARMEHRERYLARHPDEDKEIYSGYIFRTRLTYQFTREWYLRLIVQYDDFRERLDIEPLLTYRLNPFTVFYAGFNSRYQYFDEGDYSEVDDSVWELSSRQFFAKLQYLFRI